MQGSDLELAVEQIKFVFSMNRKAKAMSQTSHMTIADLARVPGKAELIDGAIVMMSPTGFLPNYATGEIYASLREYAHRMRTCFAISDSAGFVVDLPHRQSFSPDVAYYTGKQTGMNFLEGAPIFAVEVRSKSDYGPAAEQEMAEKRADYFAAGTKVIWDVDLQDPDVVRVYRADKPTEAVIYRRGDRAEAEPSVPGWSMPVDDLFPYETKSS